MGHKNKESLVLQIVAFLSSLRRFGQKRGADKKSGRYRSGIYSYSTLQSYIKWCCKFAEYCKNKYKCKTIEQCRQYVDEWLTFLMTYCTPSTSKLAACALAKLYQCRSTVFVHTPDRRRADIKRSRGLKVRDKHFSEANHQDLVDFCRSTGLRRHELCYLRGTDLSFVGGRWCIHVRKGKGGKPREAQIIGDVQKIVDMMLRAGEGKVFEKVPEIADIHGYRREYAQVFYNILARPVDTLTRKQVYKCRGDKAGVIYDKRAMGRVSKSMGHERVDVIARNYLD